jgi:hypothetical protein
MRFYPSTFFHHLICRGPKQRIFLHQLQALRVGLLYLVQNLSVCPPFMMRKRGDKTLLVLRQRRFESQLILRQSGLIKTSNILANLERNSNSNLKFWVIQSHLKVNDRESKKDGQC